LWHMGTYATPSCDMYTCYMSDLQGFTEQGLAVPCQQAQHHLCPMDKGQEHPIQHGMRDSL